MGYSFENLPQLVDIRDTIPREGAYGDQSRPIPKLTRVWHHSLTKKMLSGSVAEAFARYHIGLWGKSIGYHIVIEPQNIIQTPKGPRAAIKYCNTVGLLTYHVGDSNWFSFGICVAGDYRYEELDDATKASIDELQEALVNDNIGNEDKSHNEMPGYGWKACCEFNYKETFKFLDNKKPEPLPNQYTIQQGDTFWGIANGIEGLTVDELIAVNPNVDYHNLQVGQVINLAAAHKESNIGKETYTGNSVVDYLKSIGDDASYSHRADLAAKYGIKGYNGSEEENLKLLEALRGGKPEPKPKNKTLYLPDNIDSWRVYPTNVAPVKGNEKGFLNPQKFNGLQYEVLGYPQSNVVTIKTQDFGRVNIYVAPSTGAVIK